MVDQDHLSIRSVVVDQDHLSSKVCGGGLRSSVQ